MRAGDVKPASASAWAVACSFSASASTKKVAKHEQIFCYYGDN
eukprot:COSAG04_NODE_28843_length_273_cov_0.586207_1_plen_42_part_01